MMGNDDSPIAPVFLKEGIITIKIQDELMKRFNIYVIGISHPVVPHNKARIRCVVSAAHTKE